MLHGLAVEQGDVLEGLEVGEGVWEVFHGAVEVEVGQRCEVADGGGEVLELAGVEEEGFEGGEVEEVVREFCEVAEVYAEGLEGGELGDAAGEGCKA